MPDAPSNRSESPSADGGRYLVSSRFEIVAILRSLIDHSALVTAQFGERGDFILTAVLAVHTEADEVILDCGADELANRRLLAASRLLFSTQIEHIRIQFGATRLESARYDGGPAFRMPIPDTVTRMQRREFYRVKIPYSQQLRCTVRLDPSNDASAVSIRIFDVSCGGVALIDYPGNVTLVSGTVYNNCEIELKDIGRVVTDLEIVHVMERTGKGALRSRLCGCRFRNMPNAMALLIQRYINKVEREQKALT